MMMMKQTAEPLSAAGAVNFEFVWPQLVGKMGGIGALSRKLVKESVLSRKLVKESVLSRKLVKESVLSRKLVKDSVLSRKLVKESNYLTF